MKSDPGIVTDSQDHEDSKGLNRSALYTCVPTLTLTSSSDYAGVCKRAARLEKNLEISVNEYQLGELMCSGSRYAQS